MRRTRKLRERPAMIAAFQEKFVALMLEVEARRKRDDFWLYTHVGMVRFSLSQFDKHLFQVFCRFEEPELASPVTQCGYSGKWNFCSTATGRDAVAKAIREFKLGHLSQLELLDWPHPRYWVEKTRRKVLQMVEYRSGDLIHYPMRSRENRDLRCAMARCVRFERHQSPYDKKCIPKHYTEPGDPASPRLRSYEELTAQWL